MHAGENLKALLGELDYSVARFVQAIGGKIPQPRVESWIKGDGNPKVRDTKILSDFFKISSEVFHEHLLTPEEVEMIVKTKNISVDATEIRNSTINNQIGSSDVAEIAHLRDKISMLESRLHDKERQLEDKERLINVLMTNKNINPP